MASTIKIKNSSTAGAVPTSGDLVQGELAINVTDRRIFTENASGTVVELGTPSIDDNGNATAITIDSSENVGIGRSPNYQLDVYRSGTTNATIASANDNVVNILQVSGSSAGVVGTLTSHPLVFTAGNTERMRIDTSGNVGIGCSSLVGSGSLSIKAGQSLQWQAAAASTVYGDIYTDASNNMVFRNGSAPTERARIDSSGNLLVGTTSGTAKVAVKGNAAGALSLVFNSTSDVMVEVNGSNTINGVNGSPNAGGLMRVWKDSGNNRSISAAGTLNASGADYAEYMTKVSDFAVAKGDVVGINEEGKLTNVFADAVSFVVKSTDPSYVGADTWGAGLEGEELEAARQTVDRIAFAGQVPVNVTGSAAGQYIIPVNDNGAIKGEAVSNPTFEQYQQAVGKVIAIEQDGRARIIVKVA